jgi:molybdenum cofactor synthesis domain-containing protein
MIPDCHPLPIEFASFQYSTHDLQIEITVEVHAIYRTGVEVEAMHGAAIAALTIYDMLKPIDNKVEIGSIKLDHKKGGKKDYKKETDHPLNCAVIVCSDSVSKGEQEDSAGKAVIKKLAASGLETKHYSIIPDEKTAIQQLVHQLVNEKFDILFFIGGTGLSPRDITPESIEPLLDRTIPGIMEAARAYGQERTPYAMLSRGVAGFIKDTLVLTLPGSTRGAEETMESIFPYLLHIFQVKKGMRHNS